MTTTKITEQERIGDLVHLTRGACLRRHCQPEAISRWGSSSILSDSVGTGGVEVDGGVCWGLFCLMSDPLFDVVLCCGSCVTRRSRLGRNPRGAGFDDMRDRRTSLWKGYTSNLFLCWAGDGEPGTYGVACTLVARKFCSVMGRWSVADPKPCHVSTTPSCARCCRLVLNCLGRQPHFVFNSVPVAIGV